MLQNIKYSSKFLASYLYIIYKIDNAFNEIIELLVGVLDVISVLYFPTTPKIKKNCTRRYVYKHFYKIYKNWFIYVRLNFHI